MGVDHWPSACYFDGFANVGPVPPAPTPTTSTSSGGSGGGSDGGGGTGGTTTSSTSGGGQGGGAAAVCGDGDVGGDEECDDNNNVDADGCEADCTLPACGNGIVDPGEVCWGGAMTDVALPSMAVGYLAATDCDADGDQDVLVIGSGMGGMYSPLVALRNDGTGALGNHTQRNVPADRAVGIAIGDLDGLAGTDVALAMDHGGSSSLRTESGQGDCTFVDAKNLAVSSSPRGIAVLSLDADAIGDLVGPVAGNGTPQLAYHRSTSSPPSILTVNAASTNPTAIVSGAIAGGGTLGVVYTDQDARKVVVRAVSGSGDFLNPGVYPLGNETTGLGPTALALGDLDGDLDSDIVTANNDGDSISVLLNDGTGTLELAGPDTSITGAGPVQGIAPIRIVLADLDADGDLDVVTINDGQDSNPTVAPSVSVLLNDGTGGFTLATSTLFPLVEKSFPIALLHDATDLALVDLNGDGALDLVLSMLVSATMPEESLVMVLLANP